MPDGAGGKEPVVQHPLLVALTRKNVLAGLMFIAIAAFGLWLARDYPLGTLRRMDTGFMPRMLCWILMALGAFVLVQGLLERGEPADAPAEDADVVDEPGVIATLWPIAVVAASLVAFALSIERYGLVVAVVSLIMIAGLAYRGLKWWETLAVAVVMTALCWAVFILGLGMSMRVLPEF